ncbi:MAG: VWA domain-containing protein [Pseudohongiella sp.]|nr:VWA domain-containing protein [Pseudohongiella sp.]MDP2126713.1 VWA domain-containing protein [Pseudohongiella sp.]
MALRSRKRGDNGGGATIAFLDVISCGFGAMILLLLITDRSNPITLEFSDVQLDQPIAALQQTVFDIRGETQILNRDLNARREQLSAYRERVALLRRELSNVQGRFQTSNQSSDQVVEEENRLAIARQSLSAEMQRLLGSEFTRTNNVIGGIPVDSEYIIFIIDTSGSMFYNAWPRVLEMVSEVLNVYPEVKGIQVMNDMGDYMFPAYRNQWIPDTPARRQAIISTLRSWSPFSNSSPVEGITRAISTFYSPGQKVSLYVFGDDFLPGGSITRVVETVDRINQLDNQGSRLVRIHAVGFPVLFDLDPRYQDSLYRFAHLMRELAERNGGSFVGLNSYQ